MMKTFSATVITLCLSLVPTFSSAIISVPQYQCEDYRRGYKGAEFDAECTVRSFSARTPGTPFSGERSGARIKAQIEAGLPKVYTVEETIAEIAKAATKLTELEKGLTSLKAEVPETISNAATKAIKENLASTLDYLIRQDPEFRQLLKRLLQER